MKVYFYSSSIDGKINYLHIYEGSISPDDNEYAIVEKSIIQFGKPDILFTHPDDRLFVGKSNPSMIDLDEVPLELIQLVFCDEFDFTSAYFQDVNI